MLKSIIAKVFDSPAKKIHLRHILYLGLHIEQQALNFYENMEKTVKDQHTKDLFKRLAKDEISHVQLLNDIVSHWRTIPVSQKDLDVLDSGQKLRRLFSNILHPGSTKEIIEYALEEERKLVSFYTRFIGEFTSVWKIKKIKKIISEETYHLKKLENALYFV